ncbi:MAG: DUF6364 family protein [Acidimicrobiales bacterium]
MTSRNITLSLSDELIRKAKVLAAQRETSVSALVGSLLAQLVGHVEEYDRLWTDEEEAMASGPLRVGPITWSRAELHEP